MVIKEEFISDEIIKKDILPLSFINKSPFTGSKGKIRYKLWMFEEDGGKKIKAVWWPGPFCFDKTPDEEKTEAVFPFSEDGILEIISWLNAAKKENSL